MAELVKPASVPQELAGLYNDLMNGTGTNMVSPMESGGDQKRILAVDDIQEVLNNIASILGSTYDVRITKSVDTAFLLMKKVKFDLFLLDYGMPELSGIDFLKKVREDPEYKTTPVIFITANIDPDIIKRAAAFNIKGYIAKPFKPETLLNKIAEVLGG